MRATAIIQARTGSTRLPGKVLSRIKNKTMLEHVAGRVLKAHSIKGVVVATTVQKEDLAIVRVASGRGYPVYCGSETDVLDRYYQAARLFGLDHIVRITADCPLIDPGVIDRVVRFYFNARGVDYASNTLERSFPRGLDVEVFRFAALEKAWKGAHKACQREHVTPYIYQNPSQFRIASYKNTDDYSSYRWTVDTQEDLKLVRKIYNLLYGRKPGFSLRDVLDVMQRYPRLADINKRVSQKEL
ncbi:MAG: glycosyltransferase family protein [Candidatus Omnitrophica bacterium]|nr:glycosyltransferase family protein [Candidatus Omnitrophota bacterium]